ncbi:MAG: hypothetical protein M3Y12_03835 [Bacteroidota bacterium]|nr:hypothetical protein [Bacteroidota bacterium]
MAKDLSKDLAPTFRVFIRRHPQGGFTWTRREPGKPKRGGCRRATQAEAIAAALEYIED